MFIPRFYQAEKWYLNQNASLNSRNSHHLKVVLRAKEGDHCVVFNGDGFEYLCEIISSHKDKTTVTVLQQNQSNCQSPINIHIAQAISANQRMDYTVQKATELGITTITPIISQLVTVKWLKTKTNKKLNHWQNISISASEQCGRVTIPEIKQPVSFVDFVNCDLNGNKIILEPEAKTVFSKLKKQTNDVIILIGAEKGFTKNELDCATNHGFIPISLGPRILRTETVAPVILTLIQSYWGDL